MGVAGDPIALEQFQRKRAAVLRLELRQNKKFSAFPVNGSSPEMR
jgi:hypothetical protein